MHTLCGPTKSFRVSRTELLLILPGLKRVVSVPASQPARRRDARPRTRADELLRHVVGTLESAPDAGPGTAGHRHGRSCS